MTRPVVLALVLALPAVATADVNVHLAGGRLDVKARAPLSEVLDRIGKQTGMKIVYDGAPPRQLVATDLRAVTPASAVRSLLEGQNINYAASMDRTGEQVTTLMILGAGAKPGVSAPAAARAPISTGYDPSDAEINGEETGDLMSEEAVAMPEEEVLEPELEPEPELVPEKGARPDAPTAAPGVWPQPQAGAQLGVFPFQTPPNAGAGAQAGAGAEMEAPIEDPEPSPDQQSE